MACWMLRCLANPGAYLEFQFVFNPANPGQINFPICIFVTQQEKKGHKSRKVTQKETFFLKGIIKLPDSDPAKSQCRQSKDVC